MKLIIFRFTTESGVEVAVNVDHITAIYSERSGVVKIVTTMAVEYSLPGTVDSVLEDLQEFGRRLSI